MKELRGRQIRRLGHLQPPAVLTTEGFLLVPHTLEKQSQPTLHLWLPRLIHLDPHRKGRSASFDLFELKENVAL